MEVFESAVREALGSIPDNFQPYLEDIDFVVATRSPEGLLGLYEGAGALGSNDFPARVTLFKEAHEEASDTWEELVEEVRRTLLHEVGHHFQMEEDELPY
jgi:predicted Zn-dependent protease with MMP-like domain